jgi:pyruvate/2-oxoglutarate dehydrogenase complex dihydrolipoamide dehydrogenase (E3) component
MDALEGATYLEGRARFMIAAGPSTRPLSVEGFDRVDWHTNRTVMGLKKAPESMVIIGAGPEGLEFAQMFAHFGTNVTVVVADGHRVLRREEPEIVAEILRSLSD